MDPFLLTGLTFLAAYLVGGIPFGYLIARCRGVDISKQGSGNIGATNVGRVLGRRFGILVFLLDFAKGAVPVLLALRAAALADPAGWLTPEALGVTAGLATFLGHLFPVYLRFRGGKGVATGAGVVAVLLPLPALGGLLVWLAALCAARYVSLASLAAALALCLVRLTLTPEPFAKENSILTVFCLVVAGLVFLRHRSNLTRLLHGNENQLRDSPTMQLFTKTVHVLALGLWFGTTVFFTFVVGLSLFHTFETLGEQTERPAWFPLPEQFARHDSKLDGPKEQGTRAAGYAVGPLFPWYFLIQGVCGFLAIGTALGLARSEPARVHKLRTVLLLLALTTVVGGWPLERKVHDLRQPRYHAVEVFLQSPPASAEAAKTEALRAKAEFGMWHGFSLLLNFATVGLVAIGMALAARLPAPELSSPATANGPAALPSAETAASVPQPVPHGGPRISRP